MVLLGLLLAIKWEEMNVNFIIIIFFKLPLKNIFHANIRILPFVFLNIKWFFNKVKSFRNVSSYVIGLKLMFLNI